VSNRDAEENQTGRKESEIFATIQGTGFKISQLEDGN
jgi:hypothetical protein